MLEEARRESFPIGVAQTEQASNSIPHLRSIGAPLNAVETAKLIDRRNTGRTAGEADADLIRSRFDDLEVLRGAQLLEHGAGLPAHSANFRNLFMYAPQGKKDGIQIIPISEVAAKDEFLNIKNVTRDDILAAHRVPPQLLGVVPANAGGFGDVAKARDVFYWSEIVPLQRRFEALNEAIGVEAVAFDPYAALSGQAA